jgi:hypothetical protein
MKKLVFAFCVMFGAVVVNAQDSTSTPSPTDPTSTQTETSATLQDEGRVKIKSQDLPDAVKSSLESQEYRGWLVNSAYKQESMSTSSDTTSSVSTTGDSTNVSSDTQTSSSSYNKEVYIVELKNGAQTKTVRFDKDGKLLDDEDGNDDQK